MRQRGLQPTIYLESAKNLKSLPNLAFDKSASIELATSFPTPKPGVNGILGVWMSKNDLEKFCEKNIPGLFLENSGQGA